VSVHQVLVGASYGDAITREALLLRDALRTWGPSDIFARHVDPAIAGDVLPLRDLPPPGDAALVFHLSIGDDEVLARIDVETAPVVVRYHNVTPSAHFPHDAPFAALLDLGRGALGHLAARGGVALADSAYNATELVAAGFADIQVVAPLSPWPALLDIPSHADLDHHLDVMVGGPLVLCVAQVLPHKRLDLVVGAFHLFTTYHHPDAQLVVVGAARDLAHLDALHGLQRELNLANVWFTGSMSDAQLATCYRHADVFVTLSDHEGFCVPLVEAMAFGVPVVARGTTAIPGTLGGAGLLLPAEAGRLEACEALALVVDDLAVRADLVARGRERSDAFRPERLVAQLLDVLAAVRPVGA
jgi:glycosyltransferase involved in cell wall biosynthesis